MSWYWLRVSDRKSIDQAFRNGVGVLAADSWHRLDLIATPAIIAAAERLIPTMLGGNILHGGLIGEGTGYEVMDCLQTIYAEADEHALGADIVRKFVCRYDLAENFVIDFYEPAIHPGIELGWRELD